MSGHVAEQMVWIDCEMTGLDLDRDELVEIAVLVTDSDLNVLGEGVDIVIKPSAEALDGMGDFVRSMHTTSGLLTELADGVSLAEAEETCLAYIRQWIPTAGRAPLAGNTVSTDRAFIDKYLPGLGNHLHYRTIDVSSIKELARRWYPRVYFHSPEKNGGHRALADIIESIQELRYYRRALFVPEPGPDTETAKQIAAEVVAQSRAATEALGHAETDGTAPEVGLGED